MGQQLRRVRSMGCPQGSRLPMAAWVMEAALRRPRAAATLSLPRRCCMMRHALPGAC